MQTNPQRSYSVKFYGSPSYDLYEFDGKLSNEKPQQSQSWEATQKEEVEIGVRKKFHFMIYILQMEKNVLAQAQENHEKKIIPKK